jgi:hypothetical protein
VFQDDGEHAPFAFDRDKARVVRITVVGTHSYFNPVLELGIPFVYSNRVMPGCGSEKEVMNVKGYY